MGPAPLVQLQAVVGRIGSPELEEQVAAAGLSAVLAWLQEKRGAAMRQQRRQQQQQLAAVLQQLLGHMGSQG